MTLDELASHVRAVASERPGQRLIVGLVGAPGVGKSTVTERLIADLGASSIALPMDGFHLSNEVLVRHGSRDRKGAPDTFDAGGFVALLERVRHDDGEPVYAPRFHREIEESIMAEIEILPRHRIVIAEGNYLLLDSGRWAAARALIDVAVYLELNESVRIERLTERHIRFGKAADEARAWALGSDQRNADAVAASAERADIHLHLPDA